jgi:hypothetical protein
MENCQTTSSQIWTEVFASAGLCGVLALCSATLGATDTQNIKAINNFAVANSYVRPHMIEQVLWILRKALTQTSGGSD